MATSSNVRTRSMARIGLSVLALGVLSTGGAPASAAGASVCQVSLAANFAPGLAGTGNTIQSPASHALTLAGSQSCPGSTPSSATVSVGTTFTSPATNPIDIANGITTYTWRDPVGSTLGGCINNTSTAIAISRWADGGVSIIQIQTGSFTYGVELNGTGIATANATAVNAAPGQPATLTVSATRDIGAVAVGMLGAAADSPTAGQAAFNACNAATGLQNVTLTGVETIAGGS